MSEQHQGEPVAWIVHWAEDGSFYTFTRDKTRSEKLRNDPEFISTPLYTHADPGEVERLHGKIETMRNKNNEYCEEVMSLRAQLAEAREDRNKLGDRYDAAEAKLAERDALLRQCIENEEGFSFDHGLLDRIKSVLSASAEPSAPKETP